WFLTRGDGIARHTSLTFAPFLQKTFKSSDRTVVASGLRIDYQSGFKPFLSPRLTAAREWRGFVFRTGGGLFVRNVPSSVFMSVLAADPLHLQQFVTTNFSFDEIHRAPSSGDQA